MGESCSFWVSMGGGGGEAVAWRLDSPPGLSGLFLFHRGLLHTRSCSYLIVSCVEISSVLSALLLRESFKEINRESRPGIV